jgi:hypothetical protein
MTKCNSCEKRFDGTGGNGYQPCGCKRGPPSPPASPGPRDTPKGSMLKRTALTLLTCALCLLGAWVMAWVTEQSWPTGRHLWFFWAGAAYIEIATRLHK